MTWFQVLLTVHLLAAMTWVGGALVGVLLGSQLRRQGDAPTMGRYCLAFATVAGPAFGGSGLLVLLSGIGMVADATYIDFAEPWVSYGFGGWLVSMVLGATVVGRAWFTLGRELTVEGATLEGHTAAIRRAVNLTWVDLALRASIVVVMVWRPT